MVAIKHLSGTCYLIDFALTLVKTNHVMSTIKTIDFAHYAPINLKPVGGRGVVGDGVRGRAWGGAFE